MKTSAFYKTVTVAATACAALTMSVSSAFAEGTPSPSPSPSTTTTPAPSDNGGAESDNGGAEVTEAPTEGTVPTTEATPTQESPTAETPQQAPQQVTEQAPQQNIAPQARAAQGIAVDPSLASGYMAVIGTPTGPMQQGKNGGTYQMFTNGAIYKGAGNKPAIPFKNGTGIFEKWKTEGLDASWTGYPISGEKVLNGGVYQSFEHATIFWKAGIGGRTTFDHGAIANMWRSQGGAGGWAGFPLSDEVAHDGGKWAHQDYENAIVYWSDNGTAMFRKTSGNFGLYRALNYQDGWLGLPRGSEVDHGGWTSQAYMGGTMYYSPGSGSHAMFDRGAIASRWRAAGDVSSAIGFPTSEEYDIKGGRGQNFQNGMIYWSESGGAHILFGAIRWKYNETGLANGGMGLPTSDEFATRKATIQQYQGGSIYYTDAYGAHPVRGGILSQYRARNWENGFLGAPTSDEYGVGNNGERRQNFEGGILYWTPNNGAGYMGWGKGMCNVDMSQASYDKVVLVKGTGGTTQRTQLCDKRDGAYWVADTFTDGYIGRSGIAAPGQKRAGDGKTPSGTFELQQGAGLNPRPAEYQRGDYVQVGRHCWIRSDYSSPSNVNTLACSNSYPGPGLVDDPAYRYFQVIGYNQNSRNESAGGAILYHVNTGHYKTAGCVSNTAENLRKTFAWEGTTPTQIQIQQ